MWVYQMSTKGLMWYFKDNFIITHIRELKNTDWEYEVHSLPYTT